MVKGKLPFLHRHKRNDDKDGLPNEIWVVILEWAVRPSHLLDLSFEGIEIDEVHQSLWSPWKKDQSSPYKPSRTNSRLRLVCRLWNEIIKYIMPDQWDGILEHSSSRRTYPTEECSRVIDTKGYARLNEFWPSDWEENIKITYTQPISTLALYSSGSRWRVPRRMDSLSDIISFPKELRALLLRFESCELPPKLLQYLETRTPVLTTLALHLAYKIPVFQEPLEIPTLKTLFISITHRYEPMWKEEAVSFRWIFPSLTNLSLEERDVEYTLAPNHPFFTQLMRHNFSTVKSLRLDPMIAQVANLQSALAWTKWPNLKVLATNFVRFVSIRTNMQFQAKEISPIPSSSIRHLIELGKPTCPPWKISSQLIMCIKLCKKIETVTLLGDRDRYILPLNHTMLSHAPMDIYCEDDSRAMKELKKVCDQHKVKLQDKNYDELVQKWWMLNL
ncbi:hypothetical protein CPB86DRAFT_828216 [Serendipita vermifera]|nr:hypothetical protein CPB86DRAFT_828216 [Serendipita vermifera]